MRFIGRERELKTLEEEYRRDSSFIVIYGRRRVGKTTLIEKFIKGKPAVYFLADLQNELLQLGRFKNVVAETFRDEVLKGIEVKDWETIFRYILRHNTQGKLIIAIDEFQYLAKVNPAIPSILQRIWDTLLKDSEAMLILSGSTVSMMYNLTLSYSSPLYGRRTAQIRLQPLDFFSYRSFFKGRKNDEIFRFYCVTGGIPKYAELMNPSKEVFTNIRENVLNRDSFLYSEPKFILREEIRDPITYFSILQVISQGERKIGRIAGKLGMSTQNLTSFMERLIELDILERKVPVTERNPEKSKKGLYFIKDNFFNFWFRYVFPNQSFLETENYNLVMNKIKSDFNQYASLIFEDVCIDFLKKKNIHFRIERIGRWWNRDTEIDILAWGEGKVLFGECKYRDSRVGAEVLKELMEKSKRVNLGFKPKEIFFALFSKRGFTKDLKRSSFKNLLLYTVEDLV
ncbi:ATP-binding protein [Hydrogenivirga sp. 128-5-R1-1]|uniref:ATP-binding protein n=1 Tax=Hydrogenivirga sp. 128-5-R1-1 TaxID=392423 RepID=UPI00015EF857|nr:ATP-binding protein [Hydrogenivirga sp. 128-5-R1-1]EDP75589.1 ATPase [Hydrogenivirga sp. 128-5-R1-1]